MSTAHTPPEGPTPENMVSYSEQLLALSIARLTRLLDGYDEITPQTGKELAEEFRSPCAKPWRLLIMNVPIFKSSRGLARSEGPPSTLTPPETRSPADWIACAPPRRGRRFWTA